MRIPAAVCLAWKNSEISAVTARAITRAAELDDIDLKALGARGRGEFQADESGADHDDMRSPTRSDAAATRFRRAMRK